MFLQCLLPVLLCVHLWELLQTLSFVLQVEELQILDKRSTVLYSIVSQESWKILFDSLVERWSIVRLTAFLLIQFLLFLVSMKVRNNSREEEYRSRTQEYHQEVF